ncbi:hypothetical protein AB5N19_03573 [Seiridium cardinale]
MRSLNQTDIDKSVDELEDCQRDLSPVVATCSNYHLKKIGGQLDAVRASQGDVYTALHVVFRQIAVSDAELKEQLRKAIEISLHANQRIKAHDFLRALGVSHTIYDDVSRASFKTSRWILDEQRLFAYAKFEQQAGRMAATTSDYSDRNWENDSALIVNTYSDHEDKVIINETGLDNDRRYVRESELRA